MINIGNELSPTQRAQVREFICKIKPIIMTNDYTIKTTAKNKEFERYYNLREEEKRGILESLTIDDCVKIDNNSNPNYDESEIYVFLKKITILVYGESEEVELYIKMYLKEYEYYNMIIIISFHKSGEYE